MTAIAELVAPPKENFIRVVPVSIAAEGPHNVNTSLPPTGTDLDINDGRSAYMVFTSDVDMHILFGPDETINDPNPAETGGGTGRCWPMTAGTEYHWYVGNSSRFFKTIATGTGILRWYRG